MNEVKQNILVECLAFIKKQQRYPTVTECAEMGFSRKTVDYHFGNHTRLKSQLAKEVTNVICDLDNHDVSTNIDKTKKRFVITTIIPGAKVDEVFYKNVKAYCKDFDAQLLILLSLSNAQDSLIVPPFLKNETFVLSDRNLNSNVFLLGLKNTAAKVDPIVGLPRIGQRNGTFIGASPKQRLKYVATGTSKLPHALMSTGSMSLPNYIKSNRLIDKTSYVADSDHIMGAVIVELDIEETFHFRQVQANKDGSFVDLGTQYVNGKKKKLAPAAFILGDWHSGKTNKEAAHAWYDITKKLKIPRWVVHDMFDGDSITHHDQGKEALLAKKAIENRLNLRDELNIFCMDLHNMSGLLQEVVIVKSNHDEHLERYLNEARYISHPNNHRLCLDLAAAYIDGQNPLQYYYDKQYPKAKKNLLWLSRDEDYTIAGIQLGAHGDKGANGSRGSINAMENAYGNVIFGHNHTPEILRGAWCVGTSTDTKADYGTGPSSWMNTSCLLYEDGSRQMINVIDGRYSTREL